MHWGRVLFGFPGRVSRGQFWLALLTLLVFAITVGLIAFLFSVSAGAMNIVAMIALVPIVASGMLVGIRRLHDRDKSARWLVPMYGGPFLGLILNDLIDDNDTSPPIGILQYLCFATLVWALIELGCLRGTIGGNQYGGDPLAPQPAPPRTMVR